MTATWPTVRLTVGRDQIELASADLWDLGTTGIAEHDGTTVATALLVAGFPSAALAAAATEALDPRWSPVVDIVDGADWLDAWREHFEPFREGRIMVIPAWKHAVRPPTDDDDVLIDLDPGRAFGTGAHPSTALVLGALQQLVRGGERVLDVGCGSGVLSVAAALLGADNVVATDIDTDALAMTSENAERNGVAARITITAEPVHALAGDFDIVVANILAPVLIELAPAIAALVAPRGRLILSGLIEEQAGRVAAAYPGFSVTVNSARDPWRCLTLAR